MPYEVELYQRDGERCTSEALKAVHFAGTSPVLTEGNFVLAESGAIVGESTREPLSLACCLTRPDRILDDTTWSET